MVHQAASYDKRIYRRTNQDRFSRAQQILTAEIGDMLRQGLSEEIHAAPGQGSE